MHHCVSFEDLGMSKTTRKPLSPLVFMAFIRKSYSTQERSPQLRKGGLFQSSTTSSCTNSPPWTRQVPVGPQFAFPGLRLGGHLSLSPGFEITFFAVNSQKPRRTLPSGRGHSQSMRTRPSFHWPDASMDSMGARSGTH